MSLEPPVRDSMQPDTTYIINSLTRLHSRALSG